MNTKKINRTPIRVMVIINPMEAAGMTTTVVTRAAIRSTTGK